MVAILMIVLTVGAMLLLCVWLALCPPKKKWPPISYPLDNETALALRKQVERTGGK